MDVLEKTLIVVLEVIRLIVRVIPFWPGDKSREDQLSEIDALITELETRIENATQENNTEETTENV